MPEQGTESSERNVIEFNTKLADLEEKNNLLKEKLLILGKTLLKQEDRINKEIDKIRKEISKIKIETSELKRTLEHLIREKDYYARKEELEIINRYFKMWEPLKFVKAEEVKKMIDDALKKKKTGKKNARSN